MPLPAFFSKFGSSVKDFFGHDDFKASSHSLSVNSGSNLKSLYPGLSVSLSSKTDGQCLSSQAKLDCVVEDVGGKFEVTGGSCEPISGKATFDKLTPGLVLTAEANDQCAGVNAEFIHDSFALTASVQRDKSASASAAVGFDGFSVGAGAALDGNQSVSDYSFGVNYTEKQFTVSGVFEKKMTQVGVTGEYAHCKGMTLLAQGTYHFSTPSEHGGAVGAAIAFGGGLTNKTMIDSKCDITSVFKQNLNSNVALQVGASFNAKNCPKGDKKPKFVVGVTLGDL